MSIPVLELQNAEKKCTILAEIEEDFRHVIDDLERRYRTRIHVTVMRPVIGGGAGPEQIILTEVGKSQGEPNLPE